MNSNLVYYTQKSLERWDFLYYTRSTSFSYCASNIPSIEFWKIYTKQKVKYYFDNKYHRLTWCISPCFTGEDVWSNNN